MKLKTLILSTALLTASFVTAEDWRYVVVDVDQPMPWDVLANDASEWSTYDAKEDVGMAGKNITAAGSVTTTNITIEGGSPTNGAVWTATDNTGAGTWLSLPYIQAYNTNATTYANGSATLIPFNSPTFNFYQRGGEWDGTNWAPGVVGMIKINVLLYTDSSGDEGSVQLRINKNGVGAAYPGARYKHAPSSFSVIANENFLIYNDSATNKFSASVYHLTGSTITNNTNPGTFQTRFSGTVLP
jgi:hypothetical protein